MKIMEFPILIKKNPFIHHCLIVAIFLLLFIVFYSPILFSSYFFTNDGSVTEYFKVNSWTTDIFSGYPVLSDPTFSAFYPLRLIVYKLFHLDFNYYIVSAFILMAYFTYAYVYNLTHSITAAFVSAIIYSFSGYSIFELGHAAHFIHTICWLPLVLLAFDKINKQFSIYWAFVGLFSISFSIAAGFPQLSLALLPVIFAYALVLSFQTGKLWEKFRLYLIIIIGGNLIAAPITLSSFVLSLHSERTNLTWDFFCSYYVELKQLLLFFYPNLMGGTYGIFDTPIFGEWSVIGNHGYVGFLSIVLSIIGLWKCSNRLKPIYYFWICFAGLSVIVALGPTVPMFYKLLYHMPIINNFRAPGRYLFIFAFAISVLTGLCIGSIQNDRDNLRLKSIMVFSIFFTLLLIFTVIFYYPTLEKIASGNNIKLIQINCNPAVMIPLFWMIISLMALWFFLKSARSFSTNVFLILAICGELLFSAYFSYWQNKSIVYDKNLFYTPPPYLSFLQQNLKQTHQRFFKLQIAQDNIGRYLWGNYPVYYQLPSAGGYTPLALKNYMYFLGIANFGAYAFEDLSNNQAINIAGIKYLFTIDNYALNKTWLASKQFILRNKIGDTLVYENRNALPRVWFVDKVKTLTKSEILQTIHTSKLPDGKIFEPVHMALVKEHITTKLLPYNTATAQIEKLNDSQVIIKTNTKYHQFLVMSDTFYPGWNAYIDGKKTKLYKTDYIYRGVLINPGKHLLEFRYRPLDLYLGYAISLITFIGLLIFFIKQKSKT